jgi:hypothetical protein
MNIVAYLLPWIVGFCDLSELGNWDFLGFWEILVITAIFTEYDLVVSAVIYQAFTVMAVFVAGCGASLSACLEGGISARLSWVAADVY